MSQNRIIRFAPLVFFTAFYLNPLFAGRGGIVSADSPRAFEYDEQKSAETAGFLTHSDRGTIRVTALGLLVGERQVTIAFSGARKDAPAERLHPLPGEVNYLLGSDPANWRTHLPTWARIRYHDALPGIDLVYYGTQRELEYDFVVRPGARPDAIRIRVNGALDSHISDAGDLVIRTSRGEIVQHRPAVYQEIAGSKRRVEARYRQIGTHQFAIRVSPYDSATPLVIDPVVTYSGTFGGNGDVATGIGTDAAGNTYIAGFVTNATIPFPLTPGAQKTTTDYPYTGFVTKMNPGGDVILYSTYIHGKVAGIAVDADGNVFAGGTLYFGNEYPGCPANSSGNSFVAKVNPRGDSLNYGTCLPGAAITALAIDRAGAAYVTGNSFGSLTATPGAAQSVNGFQDAFIAKLDPGGSRVAYATYLGGSGIEEGRAIAVDADGNAYVTGYTSSPNFPAVAASQSAAGGGEVVRSADGGITWTPVAKGLAGSPPYALSTHPTDPSIIYAAIGTTASPVLYKSSSAGISWSVAGTLPSNTGAVLPDPRNPAVLYAPSSSLIYKSVDGGATWRPLSAPGNLNSVLLDPRNPSTMYAHSFPSLYRSTDSGATWQPLNLGGKQVYSVALDPVAPATMYALAGGSLLKSTDAGTNWTEISLVPGFASINQSLLIARSNNSVIYVGSGGNLLISTDAGKTWTTLSQNGIPVVDPNDAFTLYYFGNGTVSRSTIVNGKATDFNVTSLPGVVKLVADAGHPAALYASVNFGIDAFVTKVNPTGTAFIYSTYFGGGGSDVGTSIAVDSAGNAYIAGSTNSSNLPVRNALQSSYHPSPGTWQIGSTPAGSTADAFVATFDASGQVKSCTYLGGAGQDDATAIALHGAGNIFVAGYTISNDFPFTADSPPRAAGSRGAFLVQLTGNGSNLPASRFYDSKVLTAITTNSQGDVAMTGTTGVFRSPADVLKGDLIFEILTFGAASNKPEILPSGIVDVFTAKTGRGAPGTVVSIYGTNLASSTDSAPGAPLPRTLSDTKVTVNGRDAPLFYVSPGLINLQVPFETAAGVSQVVVTTSRGSSLPAAMIVRPAAPNILTDPNTNRAIGFNQSGTYNKPDDPAPVGTVLTVFLTGQGEVNGGPATGDAAIGAASVKAPNTAKIGRASAQVAYLGLTPTAVGLAQANVTIPDLPAGEYPLILTINGVDSNWSTISITGAQR